MVTTMELPIIDIPSLEQASLYLHDAVFEASGIEHDSRARIVKFCLWRELRDQGVDQRIFLFLHKWNFPHMFCVLQFGGVREFQLNVTDKLKWYQVQRIQVDSRCQEIRLLGNFSISAILKIDRLEGFLQDTGQQTTEAFGKTTLSLRAIRGG